jgi:hypothetical protein
MPEKKSLLAIIELGGYPNLMPVYQRLGFEAELVTTQRKAKTWLKKKQPDVIVAEYNFQTDFRDRSSNLETLAVVLQRYPGVRLLVLYPPEHEENFRKFREYHAVWEAISFPVTEQKIEQVLALL